MSKSDVNCKGKHLSRQKGKKASRWNIPNDNQQFSDLEENILQVPCMQYYLMPSSPTFSCYYTFVIDKCLVSQIWQKKERCWNRCSVSLIRTTTLLYLHGPQVLRKHSVLWGQICNLYITITLFISVNHSY